jgi:hypothetical protein
MKKFLTEFNKILEQDELPNIPPVEPQQTAEIKPEPQVDVVPEVETLSPEAEVLLIRLVKKALVTNIDENDVDSIGDIGDINEKNAKLSLTKLINIMKKYSNEIDVNT